MKKRLRYNVTHLLFLALAITALPAKSQNATPTAPDITVRLFFSQNVDALTITPTSQAVTVRRCSRCPDQPLRSPWNIQLHAGTMFANGAAAKDLYFSGALRAGTSGGRTASAVGKWHLHSASDGLHLTVTIPIERYVMAVLASEASPQEPPASLQALAIAARSFALTHQRRHSAEGFDLCDSTHCQAMSLGPVSDAIRTAVVQTAGEAIWFRDHRATAYFTQNCGGITESAAQLWGGPPQPWLTSHPDPWCQRTPSAWHASLNQEELRQALAFAGSPVHGPVSNLIVSKRDASGRAMTLTIVTADKQIHLAAPVFRFAVGRTLGWNRLRSDWYTTGFSANTAQFDGKGFGHGVGLCQAGAAAMAAEQHADARAILRFYFPGAEVRISATDQGWQESTGHGWKLFGISPTDEAKLLHEGDIAWSRAHTLFAGPEPASSGNAVTVRVFPSTELFRSITGEPGWVIGATRGDTISLQPLHVIEAHESLRDALLHEMLHVLVERESSALAPLWLREGLVEALASENSQTSHFHEEQLSAADIDAMLSSPSSFEQAKRAHHAAANAVRRLIDIYGNSTVRSWLSRGVPPDAPAKAGLR